MYCGYLQRGLEFLHSSNWDNLRFVLAVAETGSVSGAARRLGVNHATVLRRVAAFEAEHGGAIFEKSATGYRVLPDRVTVIEAAREVGSAVQSVERLMHGRRAKLRGRVRVSSTDSFCQIVLPPLVARLHAESAELMVDLLSSNAHLDFSRLQADISVRPAARLPDDMIGESPARLGFAAFAAPGARKVWLGLTGQLSRSVAGQWMAEHVPLDEIAAGSDSFVVLRQLALAGMGTAILPVFLGEGCSGLVRCPDPAPVLSVPIWVATHSELHDAPRIRIVREQILAYLRARADLLAGG